MSARSQKALDEKAADYEEVLLILSRMARSGDVRAAVALAGHLRKEQPRGDDKNSVIDQLAQRRSARAS